MIEEKIIGIIAQQLGMEESELTINTTFEDLGVDSLDLFQIIVEFEDAFDIQIEDAESIKTIAQAVKYVEGAIKK